MKQRFFVLAILVLFMLAGLTAAARAASFSANPTSGTAPLAVQFTDSSSGNPTSWNWDFGDGASSAEQNPTHTYSNPGTYTVTESVYNDGGLSSITNTITVNPGTLNTAPSAVPGTANGTTTITASPNTNGDTLEYQVSGSSISLPDLDSAPPAGLPVSGINLPAAAGNYIGVYEVNGSNQVVAFSQIQLTAGEISALGSDATLSNLDYNNISVPNFSPNTLNYSITLPAGTATVPTVSAAVYDSKATTAITPAAGLPGAATVVVTAQDGMTKLTYTISFSVSAVSSGGGRSGRSVSCPLLVQTHAATSITTGSAALSGSISITSNKGYSVTDYGFLWGTSAGNLTNKLDAGTIDQSGAFTADLSGLTPGTDYCFKAYATNSQGTAKGSPFNFTTAAATSSSSTTPAPITTPNAPTYSDVPSSCWAYSAIESLSAQAIVSGYPDGTFQPDSYITRAEFAAMLIKALGLSTAGTNGSFTDVASGSWCYSPVNTAVYAGLICGMGNHLFDPNALITREQMAGMVARALGSKTPSITGTELDAFKDKSEIGSWAVTGMEEAVKAGIITGITPDTLNPLGNTTRAQAVETIHKLRGFLGK